MSKKSIVISFLAGVFVVAGLVAGVLVVKQQQDIRSKAACPNLGWLENGTTTGDLRQPTFNWTWENNAYGGSGLHVNLYLWDCAARNSGCQVAFASDASGTPITSMPFSKLGHAPLECNKTYYWYAYAGDSCTPSMAKDNTWWTFTVPACPPPPPPPPPPPATHKECVNGACTSVTGSGADSCDQAGQDPCTHSYCSDGSCVSTPTQGQSTCTLTSECYHLSCSAAGNGGAGACIRVNTPGPAADTTASNCSSDSQCQSNQCTANLTCTLTGSDTPNPISGCASNADCSHFQCVNGACQSGFAGASQAGDCTSDSQCRYTTCVGSACASNNWNGRDTALRPANACTDNSTCVPPTHRACQNNTCVTLAGPGSNDCGMDSDCFHRTCQNNTCATISGPGANSCNTDSSCFHKACQNNACVIVSGGGTDSCSADANCLPPATGACQRIIADKSLAAVKIGDTVTFTGSGVLAYVDSSDAIDLIKFTILNGQTVATESAVLTTPAGPGVWKANFAFKVKDPGTYSVSIQTHWKSKNRWLR